jgi:Protein of unknown function (DUF2470)
MVILLEPHERPWLETLSRCQKMTSLPFGRSTSLATRTAATGLTSPTSASSGSNPSMFTTSGGFGVMGWVDARDYGQATPDPLSESAPGILAHMNADTADAMILLAKSHAGIEANEATMTSVDRLGFTLRLKTNVGAKGARINFLREVATAQNTLAVLVEMVRHAGAGS